MRDIRVWNQQVIAEFRAAGGVVGGPLADVPILLLHNVGARSGTARVTPLAYQRLEHGYAVFGSRGGTDVNPGWFHNVRANPNVTLEFGDRTEEARARIATGAERDRIWEQQKIDQPQFAEYERRTTRQIPVVILEPVA